MDFDSIVEARIHPAIGVARVGNAESGENGPDYFIGPEVPYAVPAPEGGYRDAYGRLKRQAARFRIYGYDKAGAVVGELTDDVADIEWHVHIANKKASWYNFDVALDIPEAAMVSSARRNSHVQGPGRAKLTIDPGPRSVDGDQPAAFFDTGEFFDQRVYLGEIHYIEGGRLLFLGGRGKSGPISPEYTVQTFANNAGWHDDTSDGPVSARVCIGDRVLPVDSAWVVTAPPNYAPDLVASQTLHDVISDALQGRKPADASPCFTRDILPIFRQFDDGQWVNAGFAAQFGWHGLIDFNREELLEKLAQAPVTGAHPSDPYHELRRQIFHSFRDPSSSQFTPFAWPLLYGDDGFTGSSSPGPRVALSITSRLFTYLRQWAAGDFVADYNPYAAQLGFDELPTGQQPAALDEAALHFCVGGPFHPGCEIAWVVRRPSMYRSLFRLRRRDPRFPEPDYGDHITQAIVTAAGGPLSASGPGDLTKWMAVPWQTDTASCRAGYPTAEFPEDDLIPAFWPSRVPNTVLDEDDYQILIDPASTLPQQVEAFARRVSWFDPLGPNARMVEQLERMVVDFDRMGIIERREYDLGDAFPKVIYVQSLPKGVRASRAPLSSPQLQSAIEEIFEIGRRLPDPD